MAEQSTGLEMSSPEEGAADLDSQSMAAIRSLLSDEERPQARRARLPKTERRTVAEIVNDAAEPAQPESAEDVTVSEPDPVELETERHGPFDPLAPQEPAVQETVETPGLLARTKHRILSYRPSRSHIIWGALALFLLFRPGLVIGVAVLILLAFFIAFMVLGYDGFWHTVMRFGHWYARRRPARAAELHGKLDQFVLKWDAFLDRFPEGTVDGLYLPDFGELERAEAAHDAALTRRLQDLEKS